MLFIVLMLMVCTAIIVLNGAV